jgi:hypothetical protein
MSARTDLARDAWALLTELAETLDHDGARELIERKRALDAGDPLIERWQTLRPRVERVPTNKEIDQGDLAEAISVAREMDRANDPAYDEARAWFHANGLPTTWRPA